MRVKKTIVPFSLTAQKVFVIYTFIKNGVLVYLIGWKSLIISQIIFNVCKN